MFLAPRRRVRRPPQESPAKEPPDLQPLPQPQPQQQSHASCSAALTTTTSVAVRGSPMMRKSPYPSSRQQSPLLYYSGNSPMRMCLKTTTTSSSISGSHSTFKRNNNNSNNLKTRFLVSSSEDPTSKNTTGDSSSSRCRHYNMYCCKKKPEQGLANHHQHHHHHHNKSARQTTTATAKKWSMVASAILCLVTTSYGSYYYMIRSMETDRLAPTTIITKTTITATPATPATTARSVSLSSEYQYPRVVYYYNNHPPPPHDSINHEKIDWNALVVESSSTVTTTGTNNLAVVAATRRTVAASNHHNNHHDNDKWGWLGLLRWPPPRPPLLRPSPSGSTTSSTTTVPATTLSQPTRGTATTTTPLRSLPHLLKPPPLQPYSSSSSWTPDLAVGTVSNQNPNDKDHNKHLLDQEQEGGEEEKQEGDHENTANDDASSTGFGGGTSESSCKVTNFEWERNQYSTCNPLHELPLTQHTQDGTLKFLACGGDRCTFQIYLAQMPDQEDPQTTRRRTPNSSRNSYHIKAGGIAAVAWKIVKLENTDGDDDDDDDDPQARFGDHMMQHSRQDGLVMERLTSSPYVLSLYGACGVSQLLELAPGGSLHDLLHRSRKYLARHRHREGVSHHHHLQPPPQQQDEEQRQEQNQIVLDSKTNIQKDGLVAKVGSNKNKNKDNNNNNKTNNSQKVDGFQHENSDDDDDKETNNSQKVDGFQHENNDDDDDKDDPNFALLTPMDQLRVAIQLTTAVADLHAQSIAHNDLCCHQFVLVDGLFKLNDFHLSSVIPRRLLSSSLSSSSSNNNNNNNNTTDQPTGLEEGEEEGEKEEEEEEDNDGDDYEDDNEEEDNEKDEDDLPSCWRQYWFVNERYQIAHAPEESSIASSDENVVVVNNEKTDVYSLGSVVWYVLTNEWMFEHVPRRPPNDPNNRLALVHQGVRPQCPFHICPNNSDNNNDNNNYSSTMTKTPQQPTPKAIHPAHQALLNALYEMMWIHDPVQRSSARDVAVYLQQKLSRLLLLEQQSNNDKNINDNKNHQAKVVVDHFGASGSGNHGLMTTTTTETRLQQPQQYKHHHDEENHQRQWPAAGQEPWTEVIRVSIPPLPPTWTFKPDPTFEENFDDVVVVEVEKTTKN